MKSRLQSFKSLLFNPCSPLRENSLPYGFYRFKSTESATRQLKVCFVNTPMASVIFQEKDRFWKNFDMRYYGVHNGQKPADASIWELPHWMTWLGGVLTASGFANVSALELYPAVPLDQGINKQRIEEQLRQNPADVYLHSPMTTNLHLAYQIADVIKSKYPQSHNIFGGVIATPLSQQVAQHPSVDFVVVDRGEYALPKLLEIIETKGNLSTVGNLVYRQKQTDKVIINPERYPFMPPQELPFPNVSLLPGSLGGRLRYLRLNYGLGCPFKCSFCTIQTIGRKTSYFPVARVLAELDAYRAHYGKHHHIYFGDETFTINKEKTIELCAALAERKDVSYDCQTRLMNMANPEILAALKDSGCKWLEVGIETINQNSQILFKQSTNLKKMEEILLRARDHGLPVCSFIINGLPDQTLDDMRRSIDFVCDLLARNLLHATYFNALVPYPGSEFFTNPDKFKIKIHHKNFKFYNEDLPPVYDTQYATSEQIYQVFVEGTLKLAAAMSTKPYFGESLDFSTIEKCGTSMNLTHLLS